MEYNQHYISASQCRSLSYDGSNQQAKGLWKRRLIVKTYAGSFVYFIWGRDQVFILTQLSKLTNPNRYLLSILLHANYISILKSYGYPFGVRDGHLQ